MNNEIIIEVKELTQSTTIRKFYSSPKKVYKLLLCGIFADLLHKGRVVKSTYYGEAKMMSIITDFHNKEKNHDMYRQRILTELNSQYYFYDLEDNSYIDEVLSFFRKVIEHTENNKKRLYQVSEIQKIYDVEKLFAQKESITLKNHHWLDINFFNPITPTIPEFFNYQDLINLWNDYVKKYSYYEDKYDNDPDNFEAFLFSNEGRETIGSMSSSLRMLTVAAIVFVESYLYYYFYNIKNDDVLSKETSIQGILNKKSYIQDTEIIEKVIFVLHQNINQDQKIKDLYLKYKENLLIRDRIVHTSAFTDLSNQMSQLQPLLQLERDQVIELLQESIDFVTNLDGLLPQNEKLLFWWERFETPNFLEGKYISPLNPAKKN